MQFPADAAPPPAPVPPPSSRPVARYLGSVALNDRTHVAWDHLDVPSTRYVQAEQLTDRDGQMVVVKVDRKALVMTCYVVFTESPDLLYPAWARALEEASATGVPLYTGDGLMYAQCWASDVAGTLVGKGMPGARVFRVSFKVSSRYTEQVAAA